MSKFFSVVLAVVGLSVIGCARGPEKVDFVSLPAGSFTTAWRADLSLSPKAVYVPDPKTLVVYTKDNHAAGVSRDAGQLLFDKEIAKPGDRLYAPIALKDWIVYPTSTSLHLIDRSGKKLRSIEVPSPLRTGGVGIDSTVYIPSDYENGSRLVALDTREQTAYIPTWTVMSPNAGMSSTPVIFQRNVFVGSENGNVYPCRLLDGSGVWTTLSQGVFSTSGAIVAPLAADKDGVYVPSMDTKLYCVDTFSGHEKWTYFSQRPLNAETRVVPTEDSVYIFVPGRGIAALDKASSGSGIHEPRWVMSDAVQFLSHDATNVYLRRADNTILAVDAKSGQVQFTSHRKDLSVFGTNPIDATIYAVTDRGLLLAIVPVLTPRMGELVRDTNRSPELFAVAR